MKISEIMEKVKAGEFSLDFCGHSKDNILLERYERNVLGANGEHDGKWNVDGKNETMEQANKRMRAFYQRTLDFDVQESETLYVLDYQNCFYCGNMLYWVLDKDKISLRNFYDDKDRKFKNYDINYKCPYENKRTFDGKVKIEDKLILSSYMPSFPFPFDRVDCHPGYLIGIENIIKYYMEKNVIYVPLRDVGIGVYLHKNKDSIIIGPSKHPIEDSEEAVEMSDEEYLKALEVPVFDGYEFIGVLYDCKGSMQATDLKTLTKENFKSLNKDDTICLDVMHGNWNFEVYYNEEGDGNNRYSILKRI